jgi:hypothetical protein
MSALRMPHPMARHSEVARTIRDGFWVIALGAIGCYAFFVALGAIKPGEVWGVTIAVAVLLALWLARAWSRSHLARVERDPRLAHARERRGF